VPQAGAVKEPSRRSVVDGDTRRGAPPVGRHGHSRRHRGAGYGRARSAPSTAAVPQSRAAFQFDSEGS
jgi:hypothetical protein